MAERSDNSDKDVWIKNFEIAKAGYHIMAPALEGIENAEKFMFEGMMAPYLKASLCEFKGVDMIGAYFNEKELDCFVTNIMNVIQENPEKVEEIHKRLIN
jgi:hypothetical protein